MSVVGDREAASKCEGSRIGKRRGDEIVETDSAAPQADRPDIL